MSNAQIQPELMKESKMRAAHTAMYVRLKREYLNMEVLGTYHYWPQTSN